MKYLDIMLKRQKEDLTDVVNSAEINRSIKEQDIDIYLTKLVTFVQELQIRRTR